MRFREMIYLRSQRQAVHQPDLRQVMLSAANGVWISSLIIEIPYKERPSCYAEHAQCKRQKPQTEHADHGQHDDREKNCLYRIATSPPAAKQRHKARNGKDPATDNVKDDIARGP